MTAISASTTGNQQVTYKSDDGTTTVMSGGSRPWRDNNPGALKYGSFAIANGAIGSDSGGFAIFPTQAVGDAALRSLLSTGYGNNSITSMIAAYAPAFENNTTAYQNFLQSQLGVPGSTIINTLTPQQFNVLVNTIEVQEGAHISGVVTGPDLNANSLSQHSEAPVSSDPVDIVYDSPNNTNLVSFVDNTNGLTIGSLAIETDGSIIDTFNVFGGSPSGVIKIDYSSFTEMSEDIQIQSANGGTGETIQLSYSNGNPEVLLVAAISANGTGQSYSIAGAPAVQLAVDATATALAGGPNVLVGADNATLCGGSGINLILAVGNDDTVIDTTVGDNALFYGTGETADVSGANVYLEAVSQSDTITGDNDSVYSNFANDAITFGTGINGNAYPPVSEKLPPG